MDDAVLTETRVASWVIVAVLVPALVILWGLSGETADLWAWTIKPDMTPVFMGAAYGAGAYFFFRVATAREWHTGSIGVLAAAIFAALMLVVTGVHWGKFNQGEAPVLAALAFFGWVVVYLAAPVIVGWLWWRNERRDPKRPAPGDRVVPERARLAVRLMAAGAAAAGTLLLVSPTTGADIWPWTLTPLTGRVIGCLTLQVAIGAFLLSREPRWSSWRLLLQTFLIADALILVGTAREWSDFDDSRLVTWLFVGGLAASAVIVVAFYAAMERRPAPAGS